MGADSKIEWTEHTFNPWEGCQKVGPGCDNCYAETRNARFGGGTASNWGPGAPRRRTSANNWLKPIAWNAAAMMTGTRPRVFCASLADVFDNAVDPSWRADLFELIRETSNLDWLLLTKRIGNAPAMAAAAGGWPDNVWLGATIVNQEEADRDVPKLLATQGPRVRFLSMEPLLGPVDLSKVVLPGDQPGQFNALTGSVASTSLIVHGGQTYLGPLETPALDWIIAGGESGPGARPSHPDWYTSLRDQCGGAGVPFLFKQWGGWAPVCAIDTDAMDADLYFPRLLVHQPEGPRRSRVEQCILQASGRRFDMDSWSRILGEDSAKGDFAHASGTRAMTMIRIGKKLAGRLLDGIQHDGRPAA